MNAPVSRHQIDYGWDSGIISCKPRGGDTIVTKDWVPQPRLRLEVRTSTDVDWSTINTANATEGAREKLRSMWHNGYSTMYPDDTEWRIREDAF